MEGEYQIKLFRIESQSEIKSSLEELADTLALWWAEDTETYEALYSQMIQGELVTDLPPEVSAAMVQGTGLMLLNDDDTPASLESVAALGQRAWERLQEIVELEVTEEL